MLENLHQRRPYDRRILESVHGDQRSRAEQFDPIPPSRNSDHTAWKKKETTESWKHRKKRGNMIHLKREKGLHKKLSFQRSELTKLTTVVMWWGVEDWDGLDIWNIRVWIIGCLLAEGWWWRGWGVGAGVGRRGNSVWGMTWGWFASWVGYF